MPDSDVPALWGRRSRNRAVLDMVNNKIYLCGEGRTQLKPPPGTLELDLTLSPSGHVMLPITPLLGGVDSNSEAVNLLTSIPAVAQNEDERIGLANQALREEIAHRVQQAQSTSTGSRSSNEAPTGGADVAAITTPDPGRGAYRENHSARCHRCSRIFDPRRPGVGGGIFHRGRDETVSTCHDCLTIFADPNFRLRMLGPTKLPATSEAPAIAKAKTGGAPPKATPSSHAGPRDSAQR